MIDSGGRMDRTDGPDRGSGDGRPSASRAGGVRSALPGWAARLPRSRAEALGAVEQELTGEKAATLGRITMALADAVAGWQRLDRDPTATPAARDEAVDRVSRAAWHAVVQRESLGMHGDHEAWMREVHGVPPAALARMGARRVLVDPPSRDREQADGIPSMRDHPLWSRRGG